MKLNLVPWPVKVQTLPGTFKFRGKPVRICGVDPAQALAVRFKLKELGLKPSATGKKVSAADLADQANTVIIGSPRLDRLRAPDQAEGYALLVDPQGVAVVGRDGDGLFWGLVTLGQLAAGQGVVPAIRIEDYPAFPFRYHHDDVSRKQISKVSDFKRIIRLLSSYKVRYYTPYFEDMLFLRSHPDVGVGRGRLMPAEVQAIRAEAKRHNVTVFPTYSLIGHQENLLQNPRYRKYAKEVFQEPSSYDVEKPALRAYLKQVIRDVCALFPDSPYFHACFDECIGPAGPAVIAHANWCAGEISRYGKQMLMWVDMFKNHWGLKELKQLDPSIIPVEWGYGPDQTKVETLYKKEGITPLGLAGYNTWCRYLPNFADGQRSIDAWTAMMGRWAGPGFGASQWGDSGYENSRDLPWNLFAYYAEAAWRGQNPRPDFESRFQTTFYGRELPPLLKLIRQTAPARKLPPRQYWTLFRTTLPAMVRLAATDQKLVQGARHDRVLLQRALAETAAAKRQAVREKDHLDHFTVAIERERNVCDRLILADKIARGLSGPRLRTEITKALRELDRVKQLYRCVWLRQFKKENIEVSLAVYDTVARSLREFLRPAPKVKAGFTPLSLAKTYNTCQTDAAGMPLGSGLVDGVPFEFAGLRHTHVNVTRDRPVVLKLPATPVRDLHLICAGQTIDKNLSRLKPVVEIELRRQGRTVFKEKLLAIRHICDWWAPRGEHMWAGGGLKYVDPKRVSLALYVGANYGVTHLRGFSCRGVEADQVVIRTLAREGYYLFAATVEKA